jgi:hypothetical protein
MVRRWGAEDIQVLDEVAQASVRDWILDHILGADRDFAKAFLESDDQFELTRHHRHLAARAPLHPGSANRPLRAIVQPTEQSGTLRTLDDPPVG